MSNIILMSEENHDMTTEVLLCECCSPDHQFLFYYMEDEGHSEVSVQPHLTKRPLLHRIGYALRYIFGYKSRFGAWDEFIINHDDIPKLQKVIAFLEKQKNKTI